MVRWSMPVKSCVGENSISCVCSSRVSAAFDVQGYFGSRHLMVLHAFIGFQVCAYGPLVWVPFLYLRAHVSNLRLLSLPREKLKSSHEGLGV